MIQFDQYFSNGLKPPTSFVFLVLDLVEASLLMIFLVLPRAPDLEGNSLSPRKDGFIKNLFWRNTSGYYPTGLLQFFLAEAFVSRFNLHKCVFNLFNHPRSLFKHEMGPGILGGYAPGN